MAQVEGNAAVRPAVPDREKPEPDREKPEPDGERAGPAAVSRREFQEFPPLPSPRKQPFRAAAWFVRAGVELVCLVMLLAFGAAIPVVHVLVLGYLLETQGRVARTGRLRSAFYLLPAAGRLGGLLLAVALWLIPLQFLAAVTRDVWLLAPSTTAAWLSTGLLAASSLLLATHLLLAMGCGGSWLRFVRPISNARRLWGTWRRGESRAYWRGAQQAMWEFMAALRLPHLFLLGLLGYAAAYFWLLAPTLLFTQPNDVTSRWQVLGFVVGCGGLSLLLSILPWLMTHVAAQGRWQAILQLPTVCRLAARTPLRWALTTAFLLTCSIAPLLYAALVKNRLPPHDDRWDVMLVFLVTVIPARWLVAWAYHRATKITEDDQAARREPEPASEATSEAALQIGQPATSRQRPVGPSRVRSRPRRWLWRLWQSANAVALCLGVGYYVYFLYLAETGGELGQRAVWQFHALLLPLPL